MCNLYRVEKNPDAIRRLFADIQIPLTFPEGIPNLPPRDLNDPRCMKTALEVLELPGRHSEIKLTGGRNRTVFTRRG